jgi:hypothetical protein
MLPIRVRRFAVALLWIALAASTAVAQDKGSLAERVLPYLGQTVDLSKDKDLAHDLYARGLLSGAAQSVTIDAAFLDRAVGSDRLYNETHSIRYRDGMRVFVRINGNVEYRGQIEKTNDDGTYDVNVWERPSYWLVTPGVAGTDVDPVTGNVPDDSTPDEVRVGPDVKNGGGDLVELRAPWLERPNAHVVKMTHAELDELNGFSDPGHGGAYRVRGLVGGVVTADAHIVDFEQDATLKAKVADAQARADRMIESGELDLALPHDPAARAAKLDAISAAQRKLILEIFEANPLPYQTPAPVQGPDQLVGANFDKMAASCTGMTYAFGAILREVGRRVGFDLRGLLTSAHSLATIRTSNGDRFAFDPAGAVITGVEHWGPWARLANLDFATVDAARSWLATTFKQASFTESIADADKTKPLTTAERTALERGYDDGILAKIVAAKIAAKGTGVTAGMQDRGVMTGTTQAPRLGILKLLDRALDQAEPSAAER